MFMFVKDTLTKSFQTLQDKKCGEIHRIFYLISEKSLPCVRGGGVFARK